jgi:hypothetical protein
MIQGYFQILMSSIEGLLRSLQVKYLVLPAAEEAVGIWTNKFAFSKLQDTQVTFFLQFDRYFFVSKDLY